MPVMQPPTRPIEVSDPNNVPETFVSGPFNIMHAGGMVHLTFTTARPNPNDLIKGSTTPEFQATVTCRLLMQRSWAGDQIPAPATASDDTLAPARPRGLCLSRC